MFPLFLLIFATSGLCHKQGTKGQSVSAQDIHFLVKAFASHHKCNHISVLTNNPAVYRAFSNGSAWPYISVHPTEAKCILEDEARGKFSQLFVVLDMNEQLRERISDCLRVGMWLFGQERLLKEVETFLDLDSDVFALSDELEVHEHYRIPVSIFSHNRIEFRYKNI